MIRIPAKALRDRDTVWVVVNNELQIRNVKIAHIDLDNVYISGGVQIGEKIVTSPIKGASKGLKIRVVGDKEIGAEKPSKRRGQKMEGSKGKWKARLGEHHSPSAWSNVPPVRQTVHKSHGT